MTSTEFGDELTSLFAVVGIFAVLLCVGCVLEQILHNRHQRRAWWK